MKCAYSNLICAYQRLSYASNRVDNSRANDLETAIEDIQLFGSQKQVELAQKFAQEIAQSGKADLDELLENLRDDLRKELRLEPASLGIKHLRITPRE